MITQNELFKIGSITKPHGLAGEVNVLLDDDIDTDDLKRVAVDIDGIYVPFYIDSLRRKGAMTLLMKFDGIDSAEQAADICGNSVSVFLKDGIVDVSLEDGQFYLSDLIGFSVCDNDGTTVGKITDIDDSTENTLFVLQSSDGKELLIPVVEDFIEEISSEDKTLVMSLPSGLFDL
ncbi:MAG: ribosome maturation factor RimM [Muribaculum sp.]|nr:ribosome maturation factor RimM [Muribaculum sp.]